MKTKLLSLFVASMLSAAACADPVMTQQVTTQKPEPAVSEAAQIDVANNFAAGECSVVCPLPNLAANDNNK